MSLDNPPLKDNITVDKNSKNISLSWNLWFSSITEKTVQITQLQNITNKISSDLFSLYFFGLSGSTSNIIFTFDSTYSYKTIDYNVSTVTVSTTSGSSITFGLDNTLTTIEINVKKLYNKYSYELKVTFSTSVVVYYYVTTNSFLTYTLPVGVNSQVYLVNYKL